MSAASFHDGDERDGRPLARWGGSLLLVLGAHAAVGIGAMSWHVAMEEAAAPPPAVMLDLAPLPEVAPPPVPMPDIPLPEPPPEPVFEPPEPEPVVEPEPIPEVEPPPPVPAEVALPDPPKPKPKPKEPPKPQPPKVTPPKPRIEARPAPTPPQPATTAAPSAPAAASSTSPAPAVARTNTAVPTWQGLVLGHLERHKRYPRSAQLRRQQGVPQVRIVINARGTVLSAKLEKSSGIASLDEETVELAMRASPLPSPPPDMAQDHIELVVPVQFTLR